MPQFAMADVEARLVRNGEGNYRIGSLDQKILVRVPEAYVRFVVPRIFLLFPLNLRQSLLLLISDRGCLRCLTTDQDCGAGDQANKLKRFHI